MLILNSAVLSFPMAASAAPSAASPATGYAPNPSTWLKAGMLMRDEFAVRASGLYPNGSYNEWDGSARTLNITSVYPSAVNPTSVTVSSGVTLLNSSDADNQPDIGQVHTISPFNVSTSAMTQPASTTDSDFFVTDFIYSQSEPHVGISGATASGEHTIDYYFDQMPCTWGFCPVVPPVGTRTYTPAQIGLQNYSATQGYAGSQQVRVSLNNPYDDNRLGLLLTAHIWSVTDLTFSMRGENLGSCSTTGGNWTYVSAAWHISLNIYVDMVTGFVVDAAVVGTAAWASDCWENGPTSFSAMAHLTNLNLGPTAPSLSVYPTQSNFTSIQLNYQNHVLASPIELSAVHDSNYPATLTVSFKPEGVKTYTKDSVSIDPSVSGTTAVSVNATLDCAKGGCFLPMKYPLVVTASSGDYSQSITIPLNLLKAKWLVMLYVAADNTPSIESTALYNIEEMINASRLVGSPKVGMMVLLDLGYGAPGSMPIGSDPVTNAPVSAYVNRPQLKTWGVSSIPAKTTQLYQVVNGNLTKIGPDWTSTPSVMNDPQTLHQFLTTAMTAIPADRNQLILSDHGGGIMGVEEDSSGRGMLMTGLASALTYITPKLDIVSFDACLMAQFEGLYTVRDYASYFTASERTSPGLGLPYDYMVTQLSTHPGITTLDYVKGIVSSFAQRYDGSQSFRLPGYSSAYVSQQNATLSAIDASKLSAVGSSIDNLASILVQKYSQKDFGFNISMALFIGSSWQSDRGFPYTDIVDFAQRISTDPTVTDAALKTAASNVVAAVKDAVVANTVDYFVGGTPLTTGYNGLTILLFNRTNVESHLYSDYSAYFTSYTSFGQETTSWASFMHDFNVSQSAATAAPWTTIVLNHAGHELFLNVYDSAGRHVGVDAGTVLASREQLDVGIPGALYLDYRNGTAIVAVSGSLNSFRIEVNGAYMQESSEPFTIALAQITNGVLASTKTVQGSINRNTVVDSSVTLTNGTFSVGGFSTTTFSSTRTIGSTTTTHTSSSSGGSSGIPEFPFRLGFTLLATIVIVTSFVLARRVALPLGRRGSVMKAG